MKNYQAIQDALIKNKGKAFEEGSQGTEVTLLGLACLVKGAGVIPIALFKEDSFSMHRVFLEGTDIYIERNTVGPILFPKDFSTIHETIADYNERQKKYKDSCGVLLNVLTLEPFPVSIVDLTPEEHITDLQNARIGLLQRMLDPDVKITGTKIPVMVKPEHAILLEKFDNESIKESISAIKEMPRDYKVGSKFNIFQQTIEDEIPPISKALFNKITLGGGRITPYGVVNDYPFTDCKDKLALCMGTTIFILNPPEEVLSTDTLTGYLLDDDKKLIYHHGTDTLTNLPVKYTCTIGGIFIARETPSS